MASDKCSSFLLAAAAAAVLVLASAPVAHSWSKEGHMLTCRIAQDLLEPAAAHAVRNLLTEEADGDLSALCVWPDQVRHWYKYRWTSPLHFIDTLTKPAASSTQGIAMARMVRRICASLARSRTSPLSLCTIITAAPIANIT
ncbi:Os04g0636400 [Oryza sativa Japonica Group]|uniref:Aspergillus nuclease S1 n=1 Tax=Oryza sativa subsp. japonica TaxID=39947 RepID=C7J139_ORYSJ|nr:Os04g0636400 [Oryza sativa Japonica Group]|eukprot:NP_001174108.1 Os04g0636400 [Oryza sativa Japonica Group]